MSTQAKFNASRAATAAAAAGHKWSSNEPYKEHLIDQVCPESAITLTKPVCG